MNNLAPFQTASSPNLADFLTFLSTVAGVPAAALPSNSPYPAWALSYAQELTLRELNCIGTDYYCFAVYLLATSFLVNWCPDQPGQTYFADLQAKFGLNSLSSGVVQSSSDEGTSGTILTPEFLKGLTMTQIQALKDPYGRQWLAMQQAMGNLWGMS